MVLVQHHKCACLLLKVLVFLCLLVSAENLEKSLRQMEKQLQQLERDLETFSSTDDPNDMFLTKMAISFHIYAHALLLEGGIQSVVC